MFFMFNIFGFGVAALVESISAIVLIVLFLMQKFGTSRVSFLFSPWGHGHSVPPLSECIISFITTQAYLRQYHHNTSINSFREKERKDGFCLVAQFFASQVSFFLWPNI